MIRKISAILVLLLCLSTSVWGSGAGKYEYQLYLKWRSLSSERLSQMGQRYIVGAHRDAAKALVCYTIVMNRYEEQMNDSAKKLCATAYNRAGYIYFYDFFDYAKAYNCFSKASKVSEEIKDYVNLSNAYQCLANVYITCAEQDEDEALLSTALGYYRKSFDIAVSNKFYAAVLSNLINMSAIAFSLNRYNMIDKELNTFNSIKFPSNLPLVGYCSWGSKSLEALKNRQPEKALECFDHQIEEAKKTTSNSVNRLVCSTLSNKAILYDRMGRHKEAVETMRLVEPIAKKEGARDILVSTYHYLYEFLTKTDAKQAGVYRYRYLELSDSLRRSNHLQDVSRLHFLNEFQKIDNEMQEMKEKRRSERIFTIAISIGLIMLVVFLIILYRKNKELNRSNRELYQKNVDLLNREKREGERVKYLNSNLKDKDKEDLLLAVRKVFENPEEFCSESFGLERLAELVGSKSKYVSQVINEAYGQSFTNVLTDSRVKEACKRLNDQEHYGNYTIEAIANSVGFKSRANFATNFKRFTGLTPSAYQRLAKENNR
ncbi:MAG: helix-turn-helix domain-containing protein [Prevotella sp.]|jgi:AraC-like DNA-binding protein